MPRYNNGRLRTMAFRSKMARTTSNSTSNIRTRPDNTKDKHHGWQKHHPRQTDGSEQAPERKARAKGLVLLLLLLLHLLLLLLLLPLPLLLLPLLPLLQPGRQAGLNEDMVAWANLKQLTDVPDGYDLSKAETLQWLVKVIDNCSKNAELRLLFVLDRFRVRNN